MEESARVLNAERDPVSFVVRAAADSAGRLIGIVERVRTGEKHRFEGEEALGRIIARLVAEESPR
jgi:hypothetical protein